MTNRPVMPHILPLYDREPWDAGPQALYPANSRARSGVSGSGPGFNGNISSPLTFPAPQWGAEAHRYAYCSNLTLPYALNSSAVLLAPVTYRNFLMLRNLSAAQTVAIQFGSDASANSALQLAPGAFILFDTVVPQDDMYVIGIVGTGNIACVVSTIALPPL